MLIHILVKGSVRIDLNIICDSFVGHSHPDVATGFDNLAHAYEMVTFAVPYFIARAVRRDDEYPVLNGPGDHRIRAIRGN